MFESWVETVGGILDVAGVPGLLTNAKEFRQTAADKASEWRAFAAAWWQKHNGERVGIAELFTLVTEQKLLDSVLGDKGEKSQRTRLGMQMSKMTDRVFGSYRIERAGEDHCARQLYRLVAITAEDIAHTATHTPPGDPGNPDEAAGEWSA